MGAVGERISREILEDVKKRAYYRIQYVNPDGEKKEIFSLNPEVEGMLNLLQISNGCMVLDIEKLK